MSDPAGFQSTPPVKAATSIFVSFLPSVSISIHAAREGGDELEGESTVRTWISIHAAREGGDAASGRGLAANLISIHAAREGGDLLYQHQPKYDQRFQSTPPVKAATMPFNRILHKIQISIHAAREGGDI